MYSRVQQGNYVIGEQMRRADTEDPRIARSKRLILEAAAQVFVRSGYDGTSVDDVAVAAGVAKRTVYNIYADKEALFLATFHGLIDVAEGFIAPLASPMPLEDPERELPDLAVKLAMSVLAGPVVPLRRLLVSEAQRFPELARDYRRRAPDAVMASLAVAFEEAAGRGLLTVPDPELAAEHFAFLVMGADLDRGMFTGSVDRTPEDIRVRAEAGAQVFLRAYRP